MEKAVFVAVALIIIGLVSLLGAALAIGAATSWILQGNFSDGWHAAWGRWPITLGWVVLFYGTAAGSNRRSRR